MKLICPECKNEVNLSSYSDLSIDNVIECDMCGITLLITKIDGENLETEIVDEGK